MSDSEKPGEPPESENPAEPKLVVDTDWKEQVAREKEQAAAADRATSSDVDQPAAADQSPPADAPPHAEVAAGAATDDRELPPPPPASFEVLVSMMFTQAMAMLGQMPDPSTGQATVNKLYAKHYIDTLDMLSEKTKGNLSDGESKVLSEALHALRMMYVSAGK